MNYMQKNKKEFVGLHAKFGKVLGDFIKQNKKMDAILFSAVLTQYAFDVAAELHPNIAVQALEGNLEAFKAILEDYKGEHFPARPEAAKVINFSRPLEDYT